MNSGYVYLLCRIALPERLCRYDATKNDLALIALGYPTSLGIRFLQLTTSAIVCDGLVFFTKPKARLTVLW